jgi:uncharacterized protein YbjT (DUF2867 family)
MKVLLLGAHGFLGRRIATALEGVGDEVLRAGRSGPLAIDIADAHADWSRQLRGVDAVVNAVGLLRESRDLSFDAVHAHGPMRLFDACAQAGVARVLQISALGAQRAADTAFLRSKAVADEHLLALPLDSTVVQPSLVFGSDGASSRLFLALAASPLIALPAGGMQAVQPVHVDDAVAAVVTLLHARGRWRGRRVALVGPEALTLSAFLLALRAQLGLPPLRVRTLPRPLVAMSARIGAHWPGALFDRNSLRMLEHGSTADAGDITQLLGRPPRPARRFIAPHEAPLLALRARVDTLRPWLHASLAVVWLWTAMVSLWLFPREDSLALLARAGVPAGFALPALWSAAALDAVFGVLTLAPLARPARRLLWASQALLIAVYSAIITVRLPEWWLHPYGPLVKNLPILVLLAWLWSLDRPQRG